MVIKKRRYFKRKIKKVKHNKLFSYKNEERRNRDFTYKNFAKSDSYNSIFTLSNFSFVNFDQVSMKYCGFNGALFCGSEFKNSNLRGSRFIGAVFKDTIFYNTKLHNVNFKNAKFENVIFISTSVRESKFISNSTPGITFYNSVPEIGMKLEFKEAIDCTNNNIYIKKSEILFYKKAKKLNSINIIRLLNEFSESELTEGLIAASKEINKDFFTLSYLTKYIRNNIS